MFFSFFALVRQILPYDKLSARTNAWCCDVYVCARAFACVSVSICVITLKAGNKKRQFIVDNLLVRSSYITKYARNYSIHMHFSFGNGFHSEILAPGSATTYRIVYECVNSATMCTIFIHTCAFSQYRVNAQMQLE